MTDGQPGLGVPGCGFTPSAADVRVVSPAPTAAQCMDDRIRDAHARAVIRPIPFPANPWRAADGAGGEHVEASDSYKGTGLTISLVRQIFDYDPVNGHLFWKVGRFIGSQAGCNKGDGYLVISLFGRTYKAHVMAYAHHFGKWPALYIDHIDGNRSNNAIANLRDVTPAVNSQNRRDVKRQTNGGYLGVKRDMRDGRFEAHITANGTYHYLGRFETAEAAHGAYIVAKRRLHEGCTL